MMRLGFVLLLAAASTTASAAEQAYEVDGSKSQMRVDVGKSGVFGFAGHRHEVLAEKIEGRIVAVPDDVARSTVELRFSAAGLKVSGKGEPAEDVPKVQSKMEGPEVLDVAKFPEILFRSTTVEGREAGGIWNLRVTGALTVRGRSKSITLPLRVTFPEDRIEATGQVVVRQTDFGIQPISVGGVVKVKDELGLDYKIVARRAP
jgi:polyisoprenoid-binding protein YceI